MRRKFQLGRQKMQTSIAEQNIEQEVTFTTNNQEENNINNNNQ